MDQGDLWSDAPEASSAPAAAASRQPAATAPVPPAVAEPEVVAPVQQEAPPAPRPVSRAPVRTQAPVAPPPEPEYYDDGVDYYYEDEQPSLLSNPYVLAAVAVLGAIVLAIIVVAFFGRGDDTPQVAAPDVTRTPTTTPGGGNGPVFTGLQARSIAIATVREGPALAYGNLGTLPANQDVDVVGRNDEATWFQIVFPFGTDLHGWVPDSALALPENVTALVPVAEPTQVTRPDIPTPTEAPLEEETPEPTETPEDEGGADIAVMISSTCAEGSEITITVSNVGDVDLVAEPIEVIVSNDGVTVFQQSFEADMVSGASASLPTGVDAEPEEMTVSVLLSALTDVDPSNNQAGCTVVQGASTVPPAIQTQLAQ